MRSVLGFLKTAAVPFIVLVLPRLLPAQTYEVSPGAAPSSSSTADQASGKQSLGWGSNIQNARLARSAEWALTSGNYTAAVDYARRAAQAAPNDAQAWFLLGYAERLAGHSQFSADAYSRGLRIHPSSLDGISGLAQTYNTMGRTTEAVSLLKRVLSTDPRRTNDAILLGELLLQAGEYGEALDLLAGAEKMQPGARSELLMAIAYEHRQQFDLANRYLESAKERDPNNVDVQRAMAGYYRETGNYEAAIAALESIHHPKPDLVAELAYTYQLDNRQAESAKLYAEAANAAPKDLGLQVSAAQAAVAAGAVESAKPFLKRAAALDPENYRLRAVRGEIARLDDGNAERNEEAVREYWAALAHLPQNPPEGPLFGIQLHINLMELYSALGNEREARSQLDIAQAEISAVDDRGPSRAPFLRLRALIKMNLGDLEGAGSDLKEALAINARDPNSLQLEGDLLAKLGHPQEAVGEYKKILAIDPDNRSALIALGYTSRNIGDDQAAENYFQRLAAAYPKLYVPYLALGDMYAARRDFSKAEAAYSKGYELAPHNSLLVAGGMNAAIETQHLLAAAVWLSRATKDMQQEPHLLREKERYLSFKGEYRESAEVGREAIRKLPKDRDVVVYLGYDLLNLQQYDELLQLTAKYEDVLTKEPDIPLLAGYVHKHQGLLAEAQNDFTRSLNRDPNVVTAYVNRGYVLHDLRQSNAAARDFESALRLDPKNGEAHLGLAYASLDLHKARIALQQVRLAQAELGDSLAIHLIRGAAYGQSGMLKQAAVEYRAATKLAPRDGALRLALADALYGQRRYHEAIQELQEAQQLSPGSGIIYARLARAYAQLHDRDQTLRYAKLAEQAPAPQTASGDRQQEQSNLFVSIGQALSLMGDQKAAMEQFEEALAASEVPEPDTAPENNRVSVRLAIAQLMANQGLPQDATRQIALALLEAETGETLPATGEQLMEAANIFLGLHDYPMAQTYFQRALAEGAPETAVRIGITNTYLALGETVKAQAQLSAIGNSAESDLNYQYLMAKANMLRQEHQNPQALTAFAQAANVAGEDQTAEQDLIQAGGNEGLRINHDVSFLSAFSAAPVFEDTTVYPLDAQLDVPTSAPGRHGLLLPPPRSSIETQWTGAYHLHLGDWPDATGYFQIRNARGNISVPSTNTIVARDTTDYNFNIGLNPTLHLGDNLFTFNTGVQETIRRDALSPVEMNQNLFRQFAYLSTSSLFNMVAVNGYAIRETGPFTESNLHSRSLTAALDFRVGRPWGKTALVTGWGGLDQLFHPVLSEDYYTSAYVGVERRLSERIRLGVVAEDLRAWRIEYGKYATAQALRPAGRVELAATRRWSVQASAAYSRNMSFHAYDAVQTGFAVSYQMPFLRQFTDAGEKVDLKYPIRFSAGMQEQSFFNFAGGQNQQFRPYLSISIF